MWLVYYLLKQNQTTGAETGSGWLFVLSVKPVLIRTQTLKGRGAARSSYALFMRHYIKSGSSFNEEIRANVPGRSRNRARAGAHGGHIQVPSLCGCRMSTVTMETELQEECSRYYGDEKSIRSSTRVAAA